MQDIHTLAHYTPFSLLSVFHHMGLTTIMVRDTWLFNSTDLTPNTPSEYNQNNKSALNQPQQNVFVKKKSFLDLFGGCSKDNTEFFF